MRGSGRAEWRRERPPGAARCGEESQAFPAAGRCCGHKPPQPPLPCICPCPVSAHCRRRRSVSWRRWRTCWSTTCSEQPTRRWAGRCGLCVCVRVGSGPDDAERSGFAAGCCWTVFWQGGEILHRHDASGHGKPVGPRTLQRCCAQSGCTRDAGSLASRQLKPCGPLFPPAERGGAAAGGGA